MSYNLFEPLFPAGVALRRLAAVSAIASCCASVAHADAVTDWNAIAGEAHYWNAAAEFDPRAAAQDQGEHFPLFHPDALTQAFATAGLQRVEVSALDIAMHFASFDDYWRPFLGGQGPAPHVEAIFAKLAVATRAEAVSAAYRIGVAATAGGATSAVKASSPAATS
jgi:hypothetical protein